MSQVVERSIICENLTKLRSTIEKYRPIQLNIRGINTQKSRVVYLIIMESILTILLDYTFTYFLIKTIHLCSIQLATQ